MANPLNSQSTEDVNPENRVAPLNPIDKCMSLADQTIRNMGFAGFDTQMFAWLGGKVDVSPLESAIGKLGELHPLVTARLNRTSSWEQVCNAYLPTSTGQLTPAIRRSTMSAASTASST